MRRLVIPLVVLAAAVCISQEPAEAPTTAQQSATAPVRTEFHVKFISGANVYIDGGRSAGLAEGTQLILKQNPTKPAGDPSNIALQPGIIAKLKVVSVASTSAVCEVEATARPLAEGDSVWMAEDDVAKLVQKDTLGNTRKYPMVVSFSVII